MIKKILITHFATLSTLLYPLARVVNSERMYDWLSVPWIKPHLPKWWLDLLYIAARMVASYQSRKGLAVVPNRPGNLMINLCSRCNYRCPMCDRVKAESHLANTSISLQDFAQFERVLPRVGKISFGGNVGESMLNRDFAGIVDFVKQKSLATLLISTNGSLLTAKNRAILLHGHFSLVAVSMHAMKQETYDRLLGAKLEPVMRNVIEFSKEKQQLNKTAPDIVMQWALNALNIDETPMMLDFIKQHDLKLNLYHFLDYQQADRDVQSTVGGEVSLLANHQAANAKIDQIYAYAQSLGILDRLPDHKPYFKLLDESQEVTQSHCLTICEEPWKVLLFVSSELMKDGYFIGVCSAFKPLQLNLRAYLDQYRSIRIEDIWNHPIFQYLRQTCNQQQPEKLNAMCHYCKSDARLYLKKMDNVQNAKLKEKATQRFMDAYHRQLKEKPDRVGLSYSFDESYIYYR